MGVAATLPELSEWTLIDAASAIHRSPAGTQTKGQGKKKSMLRTPF